MLSARSAVGSVNCSVVFLMPWGAWFNAMQPEQQQEKLDISSMGIMHEINALAKLVCSPQKCREQEA